MAQIHYFQRYSQPENVATNNSLLLLSRLYHHSPNQFAAFIDELLSDELGAGLVFEQQRKVKNSIPDACIRQSSFNLIIETKLTAQNFSVAQLKSHLAGFQHEQKQILLLLSSGKPKAELVADIENEIKAYNQQSGQQIRAVAVSFQKLVSSFRDCLESYDHELLSVVDDFEDYCRQSGLITDEGNWMRVVGCSYTLEHNLKFGVYYAKADKGYSNHNYIGLYAQKSVQGVGKLQNVIVADLDKDCLVVHHSSELVTCEQQENIKGIINAAWNLGWDISKGHKFFCVGRFERTDYRKESKYPLRGAVFMDLKRLLELPNGELPELLELCNLLKNKRW